METKIEVELKDSSPEVMEALARQIGLGLSAIGEAAEGHAKDNCPVDTGRLRNSIAYATSTSRSNGDGAPATPQDSAPRVTPEEKALYIGSNVEYAQEVEYGNRKHAVGKKHFLRDAASNHGEEYKEIMRAALDT